MRLHQKAILIYGAGALAVILTASIFMGRSGYGIFLALLPVFATASLANRHLVCPHCQKRATVLQGGMNTPWVGSKCRSCGKEYRGHGGSTSHAFPRSPIHRGTPQPRPGALLTDAEGITEGSRGLRERSD